MKNYEEKQGVAENEQHLEMMDRLGIMCELGMKEKLEMMMARAKDCLTNPPSHEQKKNYCCWMKAVDDVEAMKHDRTDFVQAFVEP